MLLRLYEKRRIKMIWTVVQTLSVSFFDKEEASGGDQ